MARLTSVYLCQQCGYKSSQYLGRCPECKSWNSFVEEVEKSSQSRAVSRQRKEKAEIINLSKIQKINYSRLSTEIHEFDRVLGGGIVLGSLVLVSGDPGIGKSTLLTQLALNINSSVIPANARLPDGQAGIQLRESASELDPRSSSLSDEAQSLRVDDLRGDDGGGAVLYIAGEESAQQIKIRVDRISPKDNLAVLNEVDVDIICDTISLTRPGLVIVDSIQTLETADLNSVAGSVGQVRESAHRLQRVAKELHIPIFLVGHVTKEGTVAGPKTLEHVVDVVLSLEGDSQSQFRILRSTKNRFGPTDEIGVFEMKDTGMIEVKNPSKLFLDQKVSAPGSVVVATLTGIRPLLVEIQALVVRSSLSLPRRTGAGIDNNRLQLLVAVLQKRLGLPLYDQDIFVNVTGGLEMREPAVDLGICLAIISSLKDSQVMDKTVLIGEVGLLGELRTVRSIDKRVLEARNLGFTHIISPENAKTLSQAAKLALVK